MKKLQPPSPLEKGHLPLSQRTPLKIEILSIPPPLFEKLVGGSTPTQQKGVVHTMTYHNR